MTLLSHVKVSQPMARTYPARWNVHTYTEGPSGLNPGDGNWDSGHPDDVGSAVICELGNLPASSTVRAVAYISNTTPCSGSGADYNGERVAVDFWVRPRISGVLRAEKYLGYAIYQHLTNVNSGTFNLTASASGWCSFSPGRVWGVAPYSIKYGPSGQQCWSGPHVHMYASRDFTLEASGKYTIGIAQSYASGAVQTGLGAGSEVYRFNVDWDL